MNFYSVSVMFLDIKCVLPVPLPTLISNKTNEKLKKYSFYKIFIRQRHISIWWLKRVRVGATCLHCWYYGHEALTLSLVVQCLQFLCLYYTWRYYMNVIMFWIKRLDVEYCVGPFIWRLEFPQMFQISNEIF